MIHHDTDRSRTAIVGVDGSDGSQVALSWALDNERWLGDETPVLAFSRGPFGEGFLPTSCARWGP